MAAAALAGIGPPANKAVPALVRLLTDADTDVREVARIAIGKLQKTG